ncbi:exosortase/archaeosortase family protein [Candidatus Beckwithbacteria bacterium]|nr:exosortase/archaeosortase family protein [Candidatus Beckwithbacteria bacterium]
MAKKTYLQTFLQNQFYQRLIVFLGLYLCIIPLLLTLLTPIFHLDQYARFAYPTVISPIILLIIVAVYSPELKDFRFIKQLNQTLSWGILSLVFLGVYLELYQVVAWLLVHYNFSAHWFHLLLVYGVKNLFYLSLFLSIFGFAFLRKFYILAIQFLAFNIIYYGLFFILFPYWEYLAKCSALVAAFLLNLVFTQTEIIIDGTNVALILHNFNVGIGEACAGTMLILLFATLYTVFCFIKPQAVQIPKAIFFLVIGSFGAFMLNSLRIFLLMVIGQSNPDLAMSLFHDHATWILFVVYFLGFLKGTYQYVTK